MCIPAPGRQSAHARADSRVRLGPPIKGLDTRIIPSRMLHEHQLLLALPDEGGWPGEERGDEISAWRMRERMKTPSLVLVLALNIGVDPPDVTKPTPCARLECWLDPLAGPVAGQKAIEAIATALQQQYEQWQPRGTKTVRACLDPTAQEVRKWCASLRRASPGRDERLLLHFNGHGVPRPTVNGEVWLFHRAASLPEQLEWTTRPPSLGLALQPHLHPVPPRLDPRPALVARHAVRPRL